MLISFCVFLSFFNIYMVERTTLKKLARWTPSTATSRNQVVSPLSQETPFVNVAHDKLQQGGLYILKIKQVSLALFEGT